MAILNLTEDSFSGDGVGSNLDAAVRRAVTAEADGADIIDIGAESARADVPVRDAGEESELVARAVERIAGECGLVISADTYKPHVAEAALQAGAHIVNDIGGFKYGAGTAKAAAAHRAALVINYTYERPKVRPAEPPRYEDLIAEHLAFLSECIATAREQGVPEDALIIDPGIAFGKSHDEDLTVLRRLGEFIALGRPLLVAASRKHFIGSVTGLAPDERDAATVAVTALSIAAGADIVRVHDVRANVQAARMADAIVRGREGQFAASRQSWPWTAGAEPLAGNEDPSPRARANVNEPPVAPTRLHLYGSRNPRLLSRWSRERLNRAHDARPADCRAVCGSGGQQRLACGGATSARNCRSCTGGGFRFRVVDSRGGLWRWDGAERRQIRGNGRQRVCHRLVISRDFNVVRRPDRSSCSASDAQRRRAGDCWRSRQQFR